MGEYTQMVDAGIWDDYDEDYEQDYSEILSKLDDPDFLRPFSVRLLTFYNSMLNSSFTNDEAKLDLQRRAREGNVDLKRGVITNWLTGNTEPKYGDDDRRRMFAVAFALGLDVKQTSQLFHKVYLDKAFNKRNVHEFIYLHCINHRKPYEVAERLIDQVTSMDYSGIPTDITECTELLSSTASQDMSESELLDFIYTHRHNFSLNNTAAKKLRKTLLDWLTKGIAGNPGLAQQEYERRRSELSDKKDSFRSDEKDPKSVDFLLYMIMGIDLAKRENEQILSIRKKFPRKEIHNQFPDKQTLSNKDPSSYVLRKDIILLYFYHYWVSDFLAGHNVGNYDGFVEEINSVLLGYGFSPLYAGNPYDWLFLYCSACTSDDYTPLDRFRGILGQD